MLKNKKYIVLVWYYIQLTYEAVIYYFNLRKQTNNILILDRNDNCYYKKETPNSLRRSKLTLEAADSH